MRTICLFLVVAILLGASPLLAQAPRVAQMWPNAGHNKQSVRANIYGSNFAVAPVGVWLSRTGYPNIMADSVSVLTDRYLRCSFNLRSAPTKVYDLVVWSTFGQDTLPKCFSIYSTADSPGVWIQSSLGSGGWYMYDAAVGDGDGDGYVEVYGANWDDTLYQFKWNGLSWDKTIVGVGDWYMNGVAIGDGNRDGQVEVYGANQDWNIYQFKWNGVTWDRDTVGAGGEFMYDVALGDGNADGETEVYGANQDRVVYQFRWNGAVWARDSIGLGGLAMLDVATGDGDNDGRIEVYGANQNNRIYQFKWNGSAWVTTTVGQGTNRMVGVTVGDGDNDGLLEVYGANQDSVIYQFTWTGSAWQRDSLGSGGSYMRGVAVGDGNGDGEREVYGANDDYYLYEFKWNGVSWIRRAAGAGGDFMAAAAVGDGNNDGKFELYGSNDDGAIYQFKSPSLPDIHVSDTTHDFGHLVMGDSLDWEYLVISNKGTADLMLGGVIVDTNAYTVFAPPMPDTLVPDDSILVTVRFKPLAVGSVPGTLSVFSNDPDESPVFVSLFGEGFNGANMTLSDTSHYFGLVAVGDSSDWQYLVIGNEGNEDLVIGGITSGNPVYSVVSPSFPDTVAPDDSTLVAVRFKPVSQGIANGTLTIFSNDPYQSPAYVYVSGEGYIVSVDPDIYLSDSTHDFGLVAVGDSADWQYLVIRNIGQQPLFVDSLITSLADYVVASPAFPETLAQNDSVQTTVRFKPVSPGVRAGTLWVHSNDPDMSVAAVALTGQGYVGIEEVKIAATRFEFGLKGNPVRGGPVFSLSIPEAAHIRLEVYDIAGRLIARPLAGVSPAGAYEVSLDPNMTSGVYFYSFVSPWDNRTGKFVLIR